MEALAPKALAILQGGQLSIATNSVGQVGVGGEGPPRVASASDTLDLEEDLDAFVGIHESTCIRPRHRVAVAPSTVAYGAKKLMGSGGTVAAAAGGGRPALDAQGQQGLELAIDDDEMSEVCSLVESAIFLGSPTVDSQSPRSDRELSSSLPSLVATIAGAGGVAVAEGGMAASAAAAGESVAGGSLNNLDETL